MLRLYPNVCHFGTNLHVQDNYSIKILSIKAFYSQWRSGGVAQAVEHLLASTRPWVQTPVLPKIKIIKPMRSHSMTLGILPLCWAGYHVTWSVISHVPSSVRSEQSRIESSDIINVRCRSLRNNMERCHSWSLKATIGVVCYSLLSHELF
jgi:hypothetical protein